MLVYFDKVFDRWPHDNIIHVFEDDVSGNLVILQHIDAEKNGNRFTDVISPEFLF